MGSARVSNAKPIAMEKPTKKSFKNIFKSILSKKKEKTKAENKDNGEHTNKIDKKEIEQQTQRKEINQPNANPLDSILENFQNLDIQENKNIEENEEEFDNFTFKVVEEPRNERIQSQTSEDSGYSETKDSDSSEKLENSDKSVNKVENVDKSNEIIDGLENLELDDEKKKKKQWKRVLVPRAPVRSKVCNYVPTICPYPGHDSDSYRQINQINKQTLTGGKVIVAQPTHTQENLSEFDIALKHVETKSQFQPKDRDIYLDDLIEYIHNDTKTFPQLPTPEDSKDGQSDYNSAKHQDELFNILLQDMVVPQTNSNTVENSKEKEALNSLLFSEDLNNEYTGYIYPTPPRSENVPSPMLESPSFYSNSEYPSHSDTLSPECSPFYNSDYEKFENLTGIPNYEEGNDKKQRERTNSLSSKTMKQFKDLQKEIAYKFSKKECCQINRKSCKAIFQERLEKLKTIERKNLCFQVSRLDMKTAFGVLHNILLSLSRGSDKEDLQYALFGLVCVHILAKEATLFVGDAGLSVLKSATLRCPNCPIFTRYLVQCIRTALSTDPSLAEDKHAVFHEVDALGDNLVIACARAGDRCADVLGELLRAQPGETPLFRVHHANADGYTALHVACSQHSASAPHTQVVHVLLEHGHADLWKGERKGGDTALHLAVNSATCDLNLVMMLFKHVDRKLWKNLAHCHNTGSVTPIEYARVAAKSTTRQNYPQEVLDFLKKCR